MTSRTKSALDNLPAGLSSLQTTQAMLARAIKAGFQWDNIAGALRKAREELDEFEEAVRTGDSGDIEDEFGDLLLILATIAEMQGLDMEEALQRATRKFGQRFRGMEEAVAAQGLSLQNMRLKEMIAFWNQQKEKEKEKEGQEPSSSCLPSPSQNTP